MSRRPVAYLVRQRGLAEYAEIVDTKKKATELACDCLWWSRQVTVTPLYAGQPMRWIIRREAARRARMAARRPEDRDTPASSSARRDQAAAGRRGQPRRRKRPSSS